MRLLITSFPLESNFGGGEKMDLLLADLFRAKGVDVNFWGSCKVLLKEFGKRDFETRKAFLVKDLTNVKSLLLAPIYITSLFVQAFVLLPTYRLGGFKRIVMVSYIEQFFLTYLAKILGFKIFWWHHIPPRNPLLKNPFFLLWKFNSRFARILASSDFVKREFEKVIDGSNIRILPNTVSISRPTSKLRPEEHSDAKKLSVGMVCRLSREKGLLDFVKLAKDFPQDDFFVAGEGDMRSEIEALVGEYNLKNFKLLGFVDPDKVSEYLSTIDIFCVLSEYESFGIVAAEASYMGLPVIASNVAALPEIVLDNETGLLYEHGNYDDLRSKFEFLAQDKTLRMKLGKNGTDFVSQRFLPTHFLKKAWDIIIENK